MGKNNKNETISSPELKDIIVAVLDENKAEEIDVIDLKGQTSIADYMIVASGSSTRQVASLADKISEKFAGTPNAVLRIEGLQTADWVVVDCGDIIVHIFRPEVRAFYGIEKMWRNGEIPTAPKTAHTIL